MNPENATLTQECNESQRKVLLALVLYSLSEEL